MALFERQDVRASDLRLNSFNDEEVTQDNKRNGSNSPSHHPKI